MTALHHREACSTDTWRSMGDGKGLAAGEESKLLLDFDGGIVELAFFAVVAENPAASCRWS
jgi:hypothetical protein